METCENNLSKVRAPWKVNLKGAIGAGIEKLKSYYSKTGKGRGTLYNLGTILNPRIKLSIYADSQWGIDYYVQYREEFLLYYQENYLSREIPGAAFKRFEKINDPLRRKLDFLTSDDELFSIITHDADYEKEANRFRTLEGGENQNEAELFLRQKMVSPNDLVILHVD